MSDNVDVIMSTIEKMTLLEIKELTDRMKEEFGIEALVQQPVVQQVQQEEVATSFEEQTEFTVKLDAAGETRINVIKLVRELSGLGLKEAKELVDSAPVIFKENVSREEADSIGAKLQEAGASVTIS